MIYQNIEIHNCAALCPDPETGFSRMGRIPFALQEALNTNGSNNCGVELRFVPQGDVRITLRAPKGRCCRAYIFYGSVQGGYPNHFREYGDCGTEIVVPAAPNPDYLARLTQARKLPFAANVVRVLLENCESEIGAVVGDCRPPEKGEVPEKTLLCYGSSITHGSMALLPFNYYPFRIGEETGMDVRNMGFAGHAFLEPEMADFLAAQRFDAATLEMGINLLGRIDAEELARRVRYFVPVIARAHPDARIYCTDMYFTGHDLMNDSEKAPAFRHAVQSTLCGLALPNVRYVPGMSLLPDALLTQDAVHPSARGVETIAMNWAKILRE